MNYVHFALLCCVTVTSLLSSEKARQFQNTFAVLSKCLISVPTTLIELIVSYEPLRHCGTQKKYVRPIHGIAYDPKTNMIALAIHKESASQHDYSAVRIPHEKHCCSIEIWKDDKQQKTYTLPSKRCCYRNGLSLRDGNLAILSYYICNQNGSIYLHMNSKFKDFFKRSTSKLGLESTKTAAMERVSALTMLHNTVFSVDGYYKLYLGAQELYEFPIFEGYLENHYLDSNPYSGVASSQDLSTIGFVCSRKIPIDSSRLDLQQISEVYISPFPINSTRNIIKYDFVQDNESWGPVKIALHSTQKGVRSALLSQSGELRLYDVESDKSFESYRLLRGPSKCSPNGLWYDFDTSGWYITHTPLMFSHCGNYLLEQSNARQLIVWDVQSHQKLETISIDNKPFVFHLAPNNTLHIGGSDGSVHRYVLE